MTALELTALQFVQASLGCIIAGFGAWGLLALACRRWPALALSRRAWLLAQAVSMAAFVLVLAPQGTQLSAQVSVVPAIELAPAPQAMAPAPVTESAQVEEGSSRWLLVAAQAWLAVYLAGVCVAVCRLVLAQRVLRRLLRGASRITDLAAHDGFGAAASECRVAAFETEVAVSPMLIGVLRPCLLLPRHLRNFDVLQQQMVVAHELTHMRRRDPLWMAASLAARTILWFNPAMRKLGERLTWSQELSCDRQVLAGRPQPQRQAYAAALVNQLKLQRSAFGAALAFGGSGANTLAARMLLIRGGGTAALGAFGRGALLAGFAAVFAGSLMLRPAFAWRIPDTPSPAEPSPIAWRAPLEKPRVSSFFGVLSPLRPRGHAGIDFVARRGTPVLASADGKVLASTDLDAGGAKYGKTILIAHGKEVTSLYAHLDRRLVAAGDVVKAGQLIGTSGNTGKTTGPHLHFEVRQAGRIVDPATVLAGLDAHATASALRARAEAPSH